MIKLQVACHRCSNYTVQITETTGQAVQFLEDINDKEFYDIDDRGKILCTPCYVLLEKKEDRLEDIRKNNMNRWWISLKKAGKKIVLKEYKEDPDVDTVKWEVV